LLKDYVFDFAAMVRSRELSGYCGFLGLGEILVELVLYWGYRIFDQWCGDGSFIVLGKVIR